MIHEYDIYFSDAKYSTKWKFEQRLERLLAIIFGLSIFFQYFESSISDIRNRRLSIMLGKNYVFWIGRIQFQEITWYVYIFFLKVKISNNHSISKDNLECLHFFFQKNNEFFFSI